MLSSSADPVAWDNVGWNSVGWNSVGWNSVGWNSSTWDDEMKTTMKTAVLVRVSGMILLGVLVSLAVLMLAYILQNHTLLWMLATVSWNG
jgi:hypothetical protein